MDVYIDLAYLINTILGYFCILTVDILTNQMHTPKSLLFLTLFFSTHFFSIALPFEWYYVWLIGFIYVYEKSHYIRNYGLFLFIHTTYIHSLEGVYLLGHIVIVGTEFHWMMPLCVGFLILFLYLCFWYQLKMDVMNSKLYSEVSLIIENETYLFRGFMDTGNQALVDGLPLIFSKFNLIKYPNKTIQYKGDIYYIQKAIIHYHQNNYPCYVAYYENLDIDGDLLLNYYLNE